MDENKENLLSIISEFTSSYIRIPQKDVPPASFNKVNKKMINSIFKLTKKFREIPYTPSEDLHSLIKVRILSSLSTDALQNNEFKNKISNCLAALEELCNDENDTEELNAVLLCLYTLSKIIVSKKRRSKHISLSSFDHILNSNSPRRNKKHSLPSLFAFQNLDKLYSNPSCFNNISWKIFRSAHSREIYCNEMNENIPLFETQQSLISANSNNLYVNSSYFNDINWDIFKVSKDYDCYHVRHTGSLYLNSPRFNDINWNFFKIETIGKRHKNRNSLNSWSHEILETNSIFEYHVPQNVESFNNIFKYRIWNFDIHRPVEPLMSDEGFITPGSNFSDEFSEDGDSFDSEVLLTPSDINIIDSKIGRQVRFTWEYLGSKPSGKEPKFASEYLESVSHLWKIWIVCHQPMTQTVPIGFTISFEELKIDINNLLFGMASNSFYFVPITKTFHIREKLHMGTVTPEALANFCQLFIECGNNYVALKSFAETKSKVIECGPVHQTFCNCIQSLLQMHRYYLLNIRWARIHHLLQLEAISLPFKRKLSFTKYLCTTYLEDENSHSKFSRGVQLLDHLYSYLSKIETTDFKFLLIYFFESCCNVYLKIVSEWIFNGCFSNPANYDEFFIQIRQELEVCWDWQRLSYVRVNEKRIPKFIEKFFKDIFACGKSVNLLRIFSKKEIFERLLPKTYPAIRCCFNSAQIEAYAEEWKHFQNHFYKKRKWCVKLKDKLTENYTADFYKQIKETRQKWFEDYERRLRERRESSTSINEALEVTYEKKLTTEQLPVIEILGSQSPCQKKLETATSESNLPTKSKNDPGNFSLDHFLPVTKSDDGTSNDVDNTVIFLKPTSDHTTLTELKLRTGPKITPSSSVFKGAGDYTTLSRGTSLISNKQTEYERNRLKSVTSDHQNQLQTPSDSPQASGQKFTLTPLNICGQNRLKNMSTTFNESLIEPNVNKVTPMTECIRNRIKVMRSEYYERLSNSDSLGKQNVVEEKSCKVNECEKNKLKVMSSEYHIRLNALAEQETAINNKLSNKTTSSKLTEREMNKQKVLSEEYHQPIKVDRELENAVVDIVVDDDSTTSTVIDEAACNQIEKSMCENLATITEEFKKPTASEQNELSILKQSMKNESTFNLEQYSKYPNIFKNPVKKTASQLLAEMRSIEDVDITSVMYYLSPSISIPLKIQSKLVNEAILWVFIEQKGYLEHLKTLRNYVLLRKAEFTLSLTNSLFEMSEDVKKPSFLLNSYTLNNILQRALSACNSKNFVKFKRNLSFVLEDSVPDSFDLTDVQMLRCLSMHYTAKWPVNVLITEPILKKYSRIFRFLIQLQRVSWVLKTDFREMKNLKQGKSVQYTHIQLYRHNMTQVIRLLKEYVMREALEQCWNDQINYLTNIKIDLDELYMSHLKYINKIIQRCFLCEESVQCHRTILLVFGSVLKYHDALRQGSWRRNEEFNLLYHTNFKSLQAVYQEFEKNLENFRAILKVLTYQKQKPYFESLFLELNTNTKNETEL